MKSILALAGITAVVCSLAAAQDSSSNRLVIPPRNGMQAHQVRVRSTNAGIVVKVNDGKDVIVEGRSSESRRGESQGMRRIDAPRGVSVDVSDNTIEVQATAMAGSPLTVLVPADTSLSLRSTNGSLSVEGVHGEIDAHTTNGRIQISKVSGTVLADTTNGGIHVSMDSVDPSKPLAFSTSNGAIDVTLPADLKANVRFKTNHGAIYSDFNVTLGGAAPLTVPDNSGQGRYRIRFDNAMEGRVNGGGVQIDFRTSNAPIYLHKR
jgi:DUF4097 and DUF4098 domain-containing protein YvlB